MKVSKSQMAVTKTDVLRLEIIKITDKYFADYKQKERVLKSLERRLDIAYDEIGAAFLSEGKTRVSNKDYDSVCELHSDTVNDLIWRAEKRHFGTYIQG